MKRSYFSLGKPKDGRWREPRKDSTGRRMEIGREKYSFDTGFSKKEDKRGR